MRGHNRACMDNELTSRVGYGAPHEQFSWDIRQEEGVVSAFEKIYDTKDLIVSFDAINIGFPVRTVTIIDLSTLTTVIQNRKDLPENKPWPHQDQNPEESGFRCLQGLVNLLPNGPDDGGLIVCKGGHNFSEEFHTEFKGQSSAVTIDMRYTHLHRRAGQDLGMD